MRELTQDEQAEIERDAWLAAARRPRADRRGVPGERDQGDVHGGRRKPGRRVPFPDRPAAGGGPRLRPGPAPPDRIPAEAIDSFAGVGHYFDLAGLRDGETVVDLGSGSGTDLFCAAVLVGVSGRAIGIDMTPAQLAKAGRLRDAAGLANVELVESRIESVPLPDGVADCVVERATATSPRTRGRCSPRRCASYAPAGASQWPTS